MHGLESPSPESYTLTISKGTHFSAEAEMTSESRSISIKTISLTDDGPETTTESLTSTDKETTTTEFLTSTDKETTTISEMKTTEFLTSTDKETTTISEMKTTEFLTLTDKETTKTESLTSTDKETTTKSLTSTDKETTTIFEMKTTEFLTSTDNETTTISERTTEPLTSTFKETTTIFETTTEANQSSNGIISTNAYLTTSYQMTDEVSSYPSTDQSSTVISTTTLHECSDCDCIGRTNISSGVYNINVNGNSVRVYCEMIHGYNWMVIFRRTEGNVAFNRLWTHYETGFGKINGDFWIGLNNLSYYTNTGLRVMRIEMEDVDGYRGYAQYSIFLVGDISTKYKLTVAGYGGTSGYDAFSYHNNMKFSTSDQDNDVSPNKNCAFVNGEPWWHRDCARMIFTRDNVNELGWYYWDTGSYKPLTKITMMVRKPDIVDTSGCSDCNCVGNLTSESGVYKINVTGKPTTVYCKMKDGYNWMVIFRRTIGDVPFNNVWSSYENGFGNKDGDHWIGLSIINHFTSSGWCRLRIEMEDVLSYVGYARYRTFLVGGASEGYKLTLSGYSGTAGFDAFSYHNNMKFSTKDNDNDESATTNCALEYGHPWWNRDCTRLKFTKDDFNNLGWYNWYTGSYEQLTKITMILQKAVN
ncbi:tenascin-like [Saccostrea cucullata]|uniref:tenascin-like n=1 Tax=Saccostrea cuccullata TaxID=36930 RepID=UPI002ED15012